MEPCGSAREAGLDRMDPGASGFIHYRHDPRNEATLSNNVDPFPS